MAHEHFLEQHDPERKDFQVDRIILFSDAVFAIAITLLVIEIKAPAVEHADDIAEQLHQLYLLLPKFIGFLLSFFVIAIYWRSHHRLFGFVNRYTNKLIWLNFLFLFSIVLMPFSSAYYSENTLYTIPFYFYNINIILTGLAMYLLIRYVLKEQNQIFTHQPDPYFKKLFRARAVTIPLIFLFSIVISPFVPSVARACPLLIWPALTSLGHYYKRQHSKTQPEV